MRTKLFVIVGFVVMQLGSSTSIASGANACLEFEQKWSDAKRKGSPQSPEGIDIKRVVDCWIGQGDKDRANAFLRHVKKEFAKEICDREGVACDVLASEELRRIHCGAEWLAPSAEAAWRDFLGALERNAFEPSSVRVVPDVRVWETGPLALDEKCNARAFEIPKSVRSDRQIVKREVMSATKAWESRSVTVSIRTEDKPWKNYSPSIYKFFNVRSCALTRPVAGRSSGYFIRIVPVESKESDPSCPGR